MVSKVEQTKKVPIYYNTFYIECGNCVSNMYTFYIMVLKRIVKVRIHLVLECILQYFNHFYVLCFIYCNLDVTTVIVNKQLHILMTRLNPGGGCIRYFYIIACNKTD